MGGRWKEKEGEEGRQDNRVALTNILHLLLLRGKERGDIRESEKQMPNQ